MKEEARFLLACLRKEGPKAPGSPASKACWGGAPGSPASGASRGEAPLDWDALFLLAESHGVLQVFYRQYVPGPENPPLPEEFADRFYRQWARALMLAREMRELLDRFRTHAIEVLPLKGPVLAELLYGQATLRSFHDLDLLVRSEDFARAEFLLLELGFTGTGAGNDYHRQYAREDTVVELHFAIAAPSAPHFNLAGVWARTRTVEFQGRPASFFSPHDLILYLSLHGMKHRFARLIWVLDLAHALETLSESDASALLAIATAERLRKLLLTSCEIARRSFNVKLPAAVASALAAQPRLAQQARALADEILSAPGNATMSPRGASRYLHLADSAGDRWSRRLQFFVPTHQDLLWTARHGVPSKCAVLVRPFRLLFKYGPAPALRTLFSRSDKAI